METGRRPEVVAACRRKLETPEFTLPATSGKSWHHLCLQKDIANFFPEANDET